MGRAKRPHDGVTRWQAQKKPDSWPISTSVQMVAGGALGRFFRFVFRHSGGFIAGDVFQSSQSWSSCFRC